MNAFITREQPNNQNRKFVAKARAPRLARWREERPQHVSLTAARFAQLESSENQHYPQQLASAFRSTKRNLSMPFIGSLGSDPFRKPISNSVVSWQMKTWSVALLSKTI